VHPPLVCEPSTSDVTLILSQTTLGTGRTTVLQGVVHLVMFAVFLFLAVVP
jgi:Ca2+:H+ antiporter